MQFSYLLLVRNLVISIKISCEFKEFEQDLLTSFLDQSHGRVFLAWSRVPSRRNVLSKILCQMSQSSAASLK